MTATVGESGRRDKSATVTITPELIRDVIQWDVLTWQRCLPHWEAALTQLASPRPKVLLLGERDGGLALWYAVLGCEVFCTDLNGPTPRAYELHRRYGVSERVQYEKVDIFNMPYSEAAFDVVGCKSVIGGLKRVNHDSSTRTLANQGGAVSEIHRVLRPGGVFLGAENLRGSPLHRVLRAAAKGDRLGWRHLARTELSGLLAAFDKVESMYFGYLGSRWQNVALNAFSSKIDTTLHALLPPDWAYVSCFRAWKKVDERRVERFA